MGFFYYFVSYSHENGRGMIQLITEKEINDYSDLLLMKAQIDKKMKVNSVILNWKLLKITPNKQVH